jgi:hypothetical protein
MLPKLSDARYEGGYRVWLRFADGVEGVVDLEDELWGEVFDALKDQNEFSKVSFDRELGTLVWSSTGADFAPEFLYQQLRPNYALKPTPQSGAA